MINNSLEDFIKNAPKDNYSYRIVVYHGEVKGAVYQNGVAASSPTAIPKELLQSLNADYYAFGHIHKPQEVFENAWYSGSACPKDFGETHDGCYNLVTIENGEIKVERVSFGFPRYTTIALDSPHFPFINKEVTPYENQFLRVMFQCTKEEKKTLNLKQLADEIKAKTNAVSVKLDSTVIDNENAPKSEVVKRKSIVEKMTEYAKEKGLKIPKRTKEILQDIQDNTLIKLAYPQHSFELLSLSLRGAIGIRDGMQKEDFEINFEKLDDGVVCLVGTNGRGKTTTVENCHPYPCMLTRDGTLKDHFYLRDSHRILTYRDENGLYYKISMLIDGKNKTGSVQYFVETSKDRESWASIPETDGSLESYKQWVNGTFGSIDVFLRTAFFAKEQTKGTPDISATTKSERMELLSKLAGTEHLKEVSVIVREKRKEIEREVERIDAEICSFSQFEDAIKENEQDIKTFKPQLKGLEMVIVIDEKKVAELKAKDAENQKVKAISKANATLYEQYKKEYEETKPLYEEFDTVINNPSIFERLKKERQIVSENAPVINTLLDELKEKEKTLSFIMEEVNSLNKKISDRRLELTRIEAKEQLLTSQIADVSEVCPTCGQPLSEHKKVELKAHVENTQNELDKIICNKEEIKKALKELEQELKEKDTVNTLKKEIGRKNNKLSDLQSESHSASEFIENIDEIYKEHSYDDAVKEHHNLLNKLNSLQAKMNNLMNSERVEDVSEELSEAEEQLQRDIKTKATLEASIRSAEKENERYKKELTKSDKKQEEKKLLMADINACLFIEEAFSNNGIPAIELRESAPEISDIANKILTDSYGNKFEIRFGSTSELKAKRKANEDFNIIVYDSENGDEKTIDTVSSGERIWIKQALFYAFSIVQMNRTGFNFRTRLIDESDGSLDGGLRPKYLNSKSLSESNPAIFAIFSSISTGISQILMIFEFGQRRRVASATIAAGLE